MTTEQSHRVKEVFEAALDRQPSERAAFVVHACAGDELLHSEVNSLLSSYEEESSFRETLAGAPAAQTLAKEEKTALIGQQISHYQIMREIGRGGMGVVYLAQDIDLSRRPVALKLLPAHLTTDPKRLRRFEREARAASALNHPYILTIYEIGQRDGLHFIATEFIDGITLREQVRIQELKLSDALNIAAQIASALVTAHEAGIVHRDIKPENIMIRGDGYVKVLDFGLAKLIEDPFAVVDTEASTRATVKTNPGAVMGTVGYMSPEQARGLAVDARTDIWSLGVLLYEMVTKRVPFRGETPSHVIVSILEQEPPPLIDYLPEAPARLQEIMSKALCKNREERYQAINELLLDLKSLRQELGPDAEIGPVEWLKAGSGRASERTPKLPGSVGLISRIKRHPQVAALLLATLLIVFSGIAFGFYRLARGNRLEARKPMPFEKIKLTSLTNTGQIKDAVISLDGKYVAYVEEVSGRESIFLRQVATQSSVQIVPPSDIQYYGLTFSNNGDSVYYVVKERNNSIGVLYQVPVLGGPSTRLIVDVDGPPSISPDGQQFAFVRGSSSGEKALMLAGADGMGERTLASRRGIDSFSFGGPAWSPDGKSVACGAGSSDTTGHYMTVVMVTINDGTVKALPSSQKWGNIGRVSWLPDGVGLIFTATELTGKSSSQLWYLSYPGGDAQRVTNDLDDYNGVSLTADSTGLVTKQTQTLSSLWVTPDGSASGAKQISSSKYDGYNGFYNRFVWMPDDRIIYTSIAIRNPGIFVMNADGTASKQLTSDPGSNTCPSVSRDGRFIVFVSDRAGSSQVWRMDVNGDNQKRLTNGSDDSWPQFSPDGQWVIYQSSVDGKRTLWKVPVEGGNPIQLTDRPSVLPMVSPDGNWIACYYRAETKSPWKLAIIPIAGGEPVKSFDIPPTVAVLSLVRWTPDGQALAYIDNREGVSNVWSLPLNGSKPGRLTDFTTERIFWFDWSRNAKQLALTRGATTSDVVLVRAQR